MSGVFIRVSMVSAAALWLACDPSNTREPEASAPAEAATPAAPEPAAPPSKPMTTAKPQVHPSGATDAVLLGDDADEALEALMDLEHDGDGPALVIDAPFVVPTSEPAVPVVGSFSRVPVAGEAFETWVTVVALSSKGISFAPALRSPKMRQKGDAVAGGGPRKASSFHFDARERLADVPWTEGEVRLHVVYGAALSVGGDAAAANPAEPSPLQLSGPTTVSAATEPGGEVTVQGLAAPSATVHVMGLGYADAFVHTVQADAKGAFSVNLLGDNPLPKAPGSWHVYAFSGQDAAGPISVELTPGSKPW